MSSWRPLILTLLVLAVPLAAADEGDREPQETDASQGCRPIQAVGEDPRVSIYPVLGIWRLDPWDCIDDITDAATATVQSTDQAYDTITSNLP